MKPALRKKYAVLAGTIATVKESEGFREGVYLDSLGNETIGIGFLVASMDSDDWILLGAPANETNETVRSDFDYKTFKTTLADADSLLKVNLYCLYSEMLEAQPWLEKESANTLEVLLDVSYNMGLGWFAKFPKTIALLKKGKYCEASIEIVDSAWAKQVKGRATRLADKLARSEAL